MLLCQAPATADMRDWIEQVLGAVEPLQHEIYGPRYRCSLTLKDGTHLPCAVVQSKRKQVDLAIRRIREEARVRGVDLPGETVAAFSAAGNHVNAYDVQSGGTSRFAIPLRLLRQIHGETRMGWTGWVFRMKDGREFSYGSAFHMEFFELPDGYDFSDVDEVVNHAYLDQKGNLVSLERGAGLGSGYQPGRVYRERVFFTCFVDAL